MKSLPFLRRSLFLILPILAALLLFSCSGDKSTDTGEDDGPNRSSPQGLLEVFAVYYQDKDLSGYADCLDDDFLFKFTPDIADSLGLPQLAPWWGRTDDTYSTGEMFEASDVGLIVFTFTYSDDQYPCEEVRQDTAFTGICCRIEPDIRVVIDHGGYETLMLIVQDSYLNVMIVPDRFAEGLWSILSIEEYRKPIFEDHPIHMNSATEPSTWRGIKSMWIEERRHRD